MVASPADRHLRSCVVISIEEFQAEVTDFLKANADEKDDEQRFVWGEGSDKVAMFEERDRATELPALAAAQEWRATRFDAGLGWITGPEEYGGRALPAAYQRAYDAPREPTYDVPNQSFFTIGLGMVAPTILAHGTPTAKDALPAGRCTAATSSAASCSPSPAPAATWPACRPGPSATATSG